MTLSFKKKCYFNRITFFKDFDLDLALAESLVSQLSFILPHASAFMMSSDSEQYSPIDWHSVIAFWINCCYPTEFQQWKFVRSV